MCVRAPAKQYRCTPPSQSSVSCDTSALPTVPTLNTCRCACTEYCTPDLDHSKRSIWQRHLRHLVVLTYLCCRSLLSLSSSLPAWPRPVPLAWCVQCRHLVLKPHPI